jgi:hypothetical protein
LTSVDVEAIDQRRGFRIGLGIESLARMAIATKKALEAKHIAILGPANNHRSACAGLQQPNATQNQGAHDPLPKLRFRNQQCP